MTKSRITAIITVVTLVACGLWLYQRADATEVTSYRFATVELADLESTVSATGALNAVTTVQVGTQVSGQVSDILVDFNSRVKAGQLLARIDPTLQRQAVAEAQAALDRATAQYNQAKSEYDRNQGLFEQQIVTASEFNAIEATYSVQQSNLRSAQISLDRARQNLAYTNIHSPIDGVIVSRSVDVGQTVAASLSTPELFRIAADLSDMQILASVDESDIGRIQNGQQVRFSVAAYPDEQFTGTVQQVRLQSATTENVVNYTVVVSVRNEDGKLLPGMTATLRFLTSRAENVLAVPNAALRYTPSVASTSTTIAERRGEAQAGSAGVWAADSTGTPVRIPVTTGMNDGQRTEVSGDALQPGMKVIIGTTGSTPASAAANPFQQQQQSGGRPRGF